MTMRNALPLLALLALPGCLSLGPKAPANLIRLTATEQAPADTGAPLTPADALTVMIPSAPSEITVTRVAVRSGAANLTYLKDAAFADAPAKLFRDLLMEVIRARTGRATLEARDYRLATGPRLTGRISTFAIDADGRKVDLVFDAVLAKPTTTPGVDPVATTRRFEAHVPIGAVNAADAGPALTQAANQVATQVADWVGR